MPAPTRTWVEVDLAAVRENLRTVAARAPGARLLPMVKANAYGLGASAVARALEALEPWGYGVATPEEGAELRAAGIRRRIIVFSPVTQALPLCAEHDLTPALGGVTHIRAWRGLAEGRPFHVQVDTGIGRAGIWWEVFAERAREFLDAPGLEGVFTHFHSSDVDPPSVVEQWGRFQEAVAALPHRPALVHAANSGAALRHPETAADLVRPGIFLYGGRIGVVTPRPVVSWRARIFEVGWREEGATVSYGATFRVRGRMSISTLAAGYADGIHRTLSNVGQVLVAGRRVGIAGRVTMDMTVVWARDWAPEEGSIATIIGRDGAEEITVDEHAERAGTIPHEVLTSIGGRVPRMYG
jgi:alanine racemase